MADEARLHEILDLVEQARAEGDKDTEALAMAAYKKESAPEPVQAAATPTRGAIDTLRDMADAGTSAASNLIVGSISTPVAGLMDRVRNGVRGTVGQIMGADSTNIDDPDKFKNFVQDNMIYHPQRQVNKDVATDLRGLAAKYIGAPMQAIDQRVNTAIGPTASNVIGQVGGTASDVAGSLPIVGGTLQAMRTAQELKAAQAGNQAVARTPAEVNRAAGIDMRPSDVAAMTPGASPSLPARALEAMTGSGETAREMSIRNSLPLQERAASAIGADLSTTRGRFTPEVFTNLKQPHNAVYDELEKVPGAPVKLDLSAIGTQGASPEATAAIEKLKADYEVVGNSADAVASVRSLRARANKQINNDNPDIQERGYAAKKIADQIDDTLAARAAGVDATLADRFKAARVALAKIHTVEDATKGGIVDAHQVLKERQRGGYMDGDLAIIADAAENAPHVTRHPQSYANAASLSAPTSLADLIQGPIRNIGGRALLRRYQEQFGAVDDSRLGDYFAQKGAESGLPPRAPIGYLPRPGEVPLDLPVADEGMVGGHPGQARVTPRMLALPAPGQSSFGNPNAAGSLADEWVSRNHPGGGFPDKPMTPELSAETPTYTQPPTPFNPPEQISLADMLAAFTKYQKHNKPLDEAKSAEARGRRLMEVLEGKRVPKAAPRSRVIDPLDRSIDEHALGGLVRKYKL